MKKLLLLALAFMFVSCTTDADDDSDDWNAAEVCPENGTNAYGMPNRGTFVDERDGRVYKYTTIGDQVWMAENLKYEAENSECKEVFDGFCEIFGRYYSLTADGNSTGALDPEIVAKMCPSGWHVPAKEKWDVLFENMGGVENKETALRIKSSDFWGEGRNVGNNICMFNALPSGGFGDNKSYSSQYHASIFAVNTNYSEYTYGCYDIENRIVYEHCWNKVSIRCLKD